MFDLIARVDAALGRFGADSGNAFLDRIATTLPAEAKLLTHLIAVAESAEPLRQNAATALLKRYLAAGAILGSRDVERLLDLLPALARWEARLQVLQMLPTIEIPERCADSLAECLRDFAAGRNKLIRAWAYGGLHRLASLHPDYAPEIIPLLAQAARTESASVRARLRHLPPLRASES